MRRSGVADGICIVYCPHTTAGITINENADPDVVRDMLLLLADEQESMIDRYLERGKLFALYESDLKSICVVTRENADTCEVKNLATYPQEQKQGYAKALLEYVFDITRVHAKRCLLVLVTARWQSHFTKNAAFKSHTGYRTFLLITTTIRLSRTAYSWWIWFI